MEPIFKEEHLKPKKLSRTFNLQISNNLLHCKKWAYEVIHGIENDRLLVICTNKPLSLDLSPDGSLQIDSHFKKPVSIKEWLACACQTQL
jgi:hypothetical protein